MPAIPPVAIEEDCRVSTCDEDGEFCCSRCKKMYCMIHLNNHYCKYQPTKEASSQ